MNYKKKKKKKRKLCTKKDEKNIELHVIHNEFTCNLSRWNDGGNNIYKKKYK